MRPLARLSPRATTRQVYQDLRRRIVLGELRPGDPLSETRVGESYGLSRTPVREVFWRLGEDGLLRVVPNVGTFVAPINVPAVYDAQFLRETLECRAVADAARRAGRGDAARLRRAIEAQAAATAKGDVLGFYALDDDMHRLLMEIAGHPFVWPVISSAKAHLDRVRFLSLVEFDPFDLILTQHRAVATAVTAHDPEAATAGMTAHLRTVLTDTDRIARQHPEFFEGSPPAARRVALPALLAAPRLRRRAVPPVSQPRKEETA
jgi:GntR family transcriptional regulator, rspAB operon transcriptional repressor